MAENILGLLVVAAAAAGMWWYMRGRHKYRIDIKRKGRLP